MRGLFSVHHRVAGASLKTRASIERCARPCPLCPPIRASTGKPRTRATRAEKSEATGNGRGPHCGCLGSRRSAFQPQGRSGVCVRPCAAPCFPSWPVFVVRASSPFCREFHAAKVRKTLINRLCKNATLDKCIKMCVGSLSWCDSNSLTVPAHMHMTPV
jgi:hypothetical protein